MNGTPAVKDDRVLEIIVNRRKVWIVRFRNDLLLRNAIDSIAELHEALRADELALATVHVRVKPDAPWDVVELLLNRRRLYAVYDGAHGHIAEEGTYNRRTAQETADRLNQQFDQQSGPPQP